MKAFDDALRLSDVLLANMRRITLASWTYSKR